MRLNFSASDGDDIREGIRRIGEVIKEQVDLYGTLTGERKAVPPPAAETPPKDPANVVPMRRRAAS
jgi:2-aminoadipate transaminase